jgi:hypothetical protein
MNPIAPLPFRFIVSAYLSLAATLPSFAPAQSVPVPKQTFASSQLYQPLRTFSQGEIGVRSTFAAMHRGHLVISGGNFSDPIGSGKLTTWRLSQSGSPNVVNPSLVGSHVNDAIFKSHAMGFVGENVQIRASKFQIYDLTNLASPFVRGTANGGVSSSHSSCRHGKYIYTGGEGYGTSSGFIDIWNVADPANPVFVRAIDIPTITGFRCASVYTLGNVLIVTASLTNGIATFDISDPENPQLLDVDRSDSGANTYTSYLSGNKVYGGGQDGGFFVYNITNPRNIFVESRIFPSGSVRYPVLQDEFIHVGNLGNGHYQKIRIDTNPPQVVADVAGFPDAEIAIPIGNLVFIGTGANSATSNPGGWLIPHDTAVDNRGPSVNAIRPVNGETNVATSTAIGVSFTDLLDTPSITNSTLIIRPQGGSALSGTYSNMGGIVNFTPAQALATNTTYEVVVTAGGVKDCSGNAVTSQTISTFSTGAFADTTNQGLVLRYPLDETSGTTAIDSAGGRNGTLNNFPATPWTDASAVGRGALNFDGVNDYVSTPSFDTGSSFSFAAYVRMPSGTGGLHTVVGNATAGFQATGWKLFIYGSTDGNAGRVQFESGNGSVGDAANTATGVFPFDRWVHVAVSVNKSSGTATIWVDGVDRTVDRSIRTDFSTVGALNWGRMTDGFAPINGAIDDGRCYNRLLGPSDVAQLRDLAAAPLAHWRFNSSAQDSSPNRRDLTLSAGGTGTGASYDTANTAEGTAAISLDGVNGYGVSPAIELGSAFTASAWVKIASGSGGLKTIFANGPSGYVGNGWNCFVYGSTDGSAGRVQFESGNGSAGDAANTAVGAFPFDRWTHVAVGVDRTLGKCRIYIDGVDRTQDESIRTDFKTNDRIHVGQMSNDSFRLGGQLDDVRLYSRWLGDQDIALLAVGKLLGHWAAEGNDNDDSGFNRFLTRQNGAGFSSSSAKGGQSLNYDGSDDFATAPAFSLGDKFTLSLWARLPADLPAGSHTLLANSPGGSFSNGFRWFVNTWATGDLAIQFETANGSSLANISAPAGTYVPGQWNHLAIVVDRAAGRADMYFNRLKVNTSTVVRNDFANTTALHLGSFTGGGAPWQGQLDEVRVYAEAVSAADIAAIGYGSPNVAPAVSNLASSNSASTTGSGVTFTATASDQNVGEPLRYFFDFGDGSNSGWLSTNSAAHTYATPGRYVVTVSVFDGYTTVTRSMTQIIYNPPTATPPSISAEMVYDSTRNKVWCVVPDGDDLDNNSTTAARGTVVRFDANSFAVDLRVNLGANLQPVACAMRPGAAELWVACKNSVGTNGQIKIVNAATGAVSATITVGRAYLPAGIAFAPDGSGAFVACEGAEAVIKYNPSTRALLASRDIGGPGRGIAVSSDSTRVFATRFRSPDSGGQVVELSAANLAVTRTFNLAPDTTTIDGPNAARGLPNYLSQAVISPDGRRLWIPGKKDNIFRGSFRDGRALNHEDTVRSLVAQLDLVANNEPANSRIDIDNAHFPTSLCFSPRGDLIFATLLGNEQVAVINPATRSTLPAISTAAGSAVLGYAPSGLCISPDGSKLYVHNFLERTVRVFNTSGLIAATSSSAPLLGTVALLVKEPLAANVLQGKKLFHNSQDPRLALDGYMSCASCHLGGDHDGRTWDLTNFGEGLRQTIDLRGRAGMNHGALHWSANFNEVQDFENQIRSLSGGTGLIANGTPNAPLGTANAGRSTDLDALAAYASSLGTFLRSPFRQSNGTLTTAATNGQTHFTDKGCANCHSGTKFTDSNASTFVLHNVGTQNAASGQRLGSTLNGIDTQTLRAVWSTEPYLHRGQAATLYDVFNTTNAPGTANHARFRELTTTQQDELIRYLLEIE